MQIRKKKMLTDFKIPTSKYFIIDCDVGGDDALCILMAAHICKDYGKQLLGITCVAGNTTLYNVAINALISCKIAGIKVPIFKGAEKNILGRPIVQNADNYFNKDGLSGNQIKYLPCLQKQDSDLVSSQRACDFIIQSAKKYKNDLGIIAIGCMTNIALAYMLDNSIAQYINCICCMGGTYSNLGRRDHFASDFNFHLDPEATEIVFRKFRNIVLTCLEFPESYQFNTNQGVFANTSNTLKKSFFVDLYSKIKIPTLCDPLTLFSLFFAEEAEVQVYYAPCKVILSGRRTRGSLSIGWLDNKEENKLILMMCGINRDFVNKLVVSSLDNQ